MWTSALRPTPLQDSSEMTETTTLLDPQLRTDGTEDIIGYRLRRAQLSVFQRFLAVFDAFSLRPAEYSVLVLVSDNPGRKQTQIAEVLGKRCLKKG